MCRIKIKIKENTAYCVWNSDEGGVIAVIINKPEQQEGDIVDVTETVRDIIREHTVAHSVDFESFPNAIIDHYTKGECVAIVQEKDDDNSPVIQTFEIYGISTY